ncbi:serine/threonine protein phosphatase [Halobacteriales archaeon QS_1_68_20]|nr:MAG: serine/threonine protein phosphatase [Halobacteriales archaeon QS_1_68_20]
MEHASSIDIGARKDRQGGINEDSVATAVFENHHRDVARPVGVFVLADGVGGEAAGDAASFLTTTVVRQRLAELLLGASTDRPGRFDLDGVDAATHDDGSALTEDRIRTAIQDAIDAAHAEVQEYARDAGGRPATTVVACVYVDGRLHYGWVGDSRAYLINAEHGEIQQLTEDHAVTNDLLEEGEIDDEVYARVHEQATAITNAVGGSPYGEPNVDVEFGTAPVFAEDVLLVTSDGLIDAYPHVGELRRTYEEADDTDAAREELLDAMVTDDEIRDLVLDAADLRTATADLVEMANDRGGKDNLSIAVARDPDADPTPEVLPARGPDDGERSLADQETVIEPAATDRRSDDDSDDGVDVMRVDGAGGGAGTAAVWMEGQETIFEIEPGFTIGRRDEDAEDNPTIGLVVDDEIGIDHHHARFERDDAGYWRVRDTSSSGTHVQGTDGDWHHLRADGDDEDVGETYRLRDGVALTLQTPEDGAVRFRFFESVDRAERLVNEADEDDNLFGRFLS